MSSAILYCVLLASNVLSHNVKILFFVGSTLGLIYSKTRGNRYWSMFIIFLGRGFLLPLGVSLSIRSFIGLPGLSSNDYRCIFICSFHAILVAIAKDIGDVMGDKAFNRDTFAQYHPHIYKHLMLFSQLQWISYFISPSKKYLIHRLIMSYHQLTAPFNNYKYIWKLFYLDIFTSRLEFIPILAISHWSIFQYKKNQPDFIPTEIDNNKLEPINYMLELPQGNSRTSMIKSMAKLHSASQENVANIIKFTELMHNGSLIIDDIQDNSDERRNQPAAHIKFGINYSIASVYMSCFESLKEMYYLYREKPKVIDSFINTLHSIHKGQLTEIYWCRNKYIPTKNEYRNMVIQKTGSPFIGALICLQELSTFPVIKNYL